MPKLHVKTGQEVKILTGADKGKTGKIIQVFPRLNRVVVEGIRLSKRHLKSRRSGEPGQVVEFAMPIHASNVALVEVAAPAKKVSHKKTKTA